MLVVEKTKQNIPTDKTIKTFEPTKRLGIETIRSIIENKADIEE